MNKVDNPQKGDEWIAPFTAGLDEYIPISAIHGTNTGDLLDRLVAYIPEDAVLEEEPDLRASRFWAAQCGKSTS